MVTGVALQPGALERSTRLFRIERIKALLRLHPGAERSGEFPEAQCGCHRHHSPGHKYPARIVQ